MIPEEKVQEIKRLLRKGEPEGEIKEQLKKEGYTEEEISNAIMPARRPVSNNGGEYPLSYFLGAGLLITGIAVLAIFRGSSLGWFFLLGGVATFIVGYFIENEKKKGQA